MGSSKKTIDETHEKNYKKVTDSFTRRAKLVKRQITKKIKQITLEKKKKAIEAIKLKMEAARKKKEAALVKLKALKAKNAWVKKADEDDDKNSKEKKTFKEKSEKLVKIKAKWEISRKKW